MPRLGQQLLGLGRVVDRWRRLPIELEAVRNEAAGQLGAAEVSAWLMLSRSIARLAARRTRSSCHGDFGSHWSAKYSQNGAGGLDRLRG